MDYSVGSLADLISGSNTPNKPKVIKKAFERTIKIENVEETINVNKSIQENKIRRSFKNENKLKDRISNIKQEINVTEEGGSDNNVKLHSANIKRDRKHPFVNKNKLKNSPRKIKVETSVVEEAEPDNANTKKDINKSFTKKNKLKKKPRKTKQQTNGIDEAEPASESANDTELSNPNIKKQKGKKRKLEPETPDTIDNTDSPPKKQKLTTYETNAARRIDKKVKEENRVKDPEELAKTLFVGNVPITCTKKIMKKLFKKYGKIQTVRFRGIPVANLKTPKKVAAIKKEFNPNRSNIICYIKFVDKESTSKAEVEDGVLFEEHHLRVHTCASNDKPDETKAIFVGNLSFNAIEDDLWKLFEPCGPISSVRIIRDPRTGMGKGFGYVNFTDSDAVQLALEMENVKLNDRELRISLCNLNTARKNKKNNRSKKITQPGRQKMRTNFKKEAGNKADRPQNKPKHVNSGFQGTKFSDKNKKPKVNRGLLEKKKLVKKIAPKPK